MPPGATGGATLATVDATTSDTTPLAETAGK
jgi:hypothetical protein